MASSFSLIQTINVTAVGGQTSMDFTVIPSTYTDLKLVISARSTSSSGSGDSIALTLNGSTSNFRFVQLYGTGTGNGAANGAPTNTLAGNVNNSTTTSQIFASNILYFTNYLTSDNKPITVESVTENFTTSAAAVLIAGLWSSSSAISSLSIAPAYAGNFAQYSTASLYGIKNS